MNAVLGVTGVLGTPLAEPKGVPGNGGHQPCEPLHLEGLPSPWVQRSLEGGG